MEQKHVDQERRIPRVCFYYQSKKWDFAQNTLIATVMTIDIHAMIRGD